MDTNPRNSLNLWIEDGVVSAAVSVNKRLHSAVVFIIMLANRRHKVSSTYLQSMAKVFLQNYRPFLSLWLNMPFVILFAVQNRAASGM